MSVSADRAAASPVPDVLPDAAAVIRAAVDLAVAAGPGSEPADGDTPCEPARSVLAAIGKAGGLRACLSQETPPGLSLHGLRTLIQHLATRVPSGVTLAACVQAALFVPIMADLAHGDQRRVLDEVLDGQAMAAVAISDAGIAGSDPAAMATTLRRTDDGWILSGTKDWVTGACIASYLVVCARTGSTGRHFSNFSLVLVPACLPGVTIRPRDTGVMQHAGLGTVQFTDVRLPLGALVGRQGRGLAYFLRYVATERLAGGFWATAIGGDQILRTAAWLRRRDLAGSSLWDNPAVRSQLAEAAVSIRLIGALSEDILRQRPTAPPPADDTAALKAALAPLLTSALGRCVQLHGAEGLTTQAGLLQTLADARAFGVAGGTTETMLELVAHSDLVLGRPGSLRMPADMEGEPASGQPV
jgi:alkylation response protein AidB-like acyl-CoA dehydrogenase